MGSGPRQGSREGRKRFDFRGRVSDTMGRRTLPAGTMPSYDSMFIIVNA